MKKLLLIDGSNLMFRAYYATAYSGNLMQNSKGEYTNAVYAFTNMLNRIIEEEFTHALVAFDKGKATFRHKTYEDYKAQRKPMPDAFRAQLPKIKEVPEQLGIRTYESEDLEADDIIGTLATAFKEDFASIEVISNDRDLYQLLSDKVTMRIARRGLDIEDTYTPRKLLEETGLTPEQIPDFKGLMGDSSDNIPGIPGVGEKTAKRLILEYGSIEGIMKNLNELKGKQKERLEAHGEDAFKWRELVRLKTDADLGLTLDDLSYEGYDDDALIEFFESLEFHSLIKRMQKAPAQKREEHIETIDDAAKIPAILKGHTIFILESYGENYHHAEKLGFALVNDAGHHFVPYDVFLSSEAMQAFFEDPSQKKSTFDFKRAYVMMKQDGVRLRGVIFDLLLAAYVLNPSNTKEDFRIVASNFDYHDVPYLEDVYGKGKKSGIPDKATYIAYAHQKAQAIKTLEDQITEALDTRSQMSLFKDMEMPLAPILGDMEIEGIRLDTEALDAYRESIDTELESLSETIYSLSGETFNIDSPKQLSRILFEVLGLPAQKKKKTGYSTSIDVLKKLRDRHPIIEHIIRYRTLSKLKSAYVKSLFESVHDDGKIHTIYKQAYTQTGRLSSVDPNMQTVPIRTEEGRALRKVFIADGDHVLLAADYSQIELRILAHLAEENRLIDAYASGEDIHSLTGREVFGKDTLTDDERRMAKAVNFGILYGQGPYGLSEELGITRKEAEGIIRRYYERFPGIASYMDGVVETAEEKGYVETLYKRRRYIPEIKSSNFQQRDAGRRNAMNAPIQGTAADIIKLAMIDVEEALREEGLRARLILQVHDELVLHVPTDESERVQALLKRTMEQAADLKVPLTVDIASGSDLDEAK